MSKKSKSQVGNVVILLLLLLLTATAQRAYAVDTTETYDVGATDFEFYLGFDGIGRKKHEKEVSIEALAGFGFIDRFSGYVTIAGASNEYFTEGTNEVSAGIFGTPLDTDHVDLDILFNGGAAADEFEVTPGLELNLDLKPDLALAGLYFRIEETLSGRSKETKDELNPKYAFAPQTGAVIGIYWTVVPDNQILLEYDLGISHNPPSDERKFENGGIALGYNAMVVDDLELLSQLYLDIPQKGEKTSVGLMVGLISTMPTVTK
jgi:hypothetical protein